MLLLKLFHQLIKALGVVHRKITDLSATEGGEVSAGAEFLADVFAEGADVSAAGDMSADFELGVIIIENFNRVDFDGAFGHIDRDTFAGEVVGAAAVDFDSGKSGEFLSDFALEGLNDCVDLGESGDFRGYIGNFAFGVTSGGDFTEAEGGFINFVEFEEGLALFGVFFGHDNQEAGGERVEGAGVADFETLRGSFAFCDHFGAAFFG